jgi:adenylyltransferase/sulfurtransferase
MQAVECIKVLTDMGKASLPDRSRRVLHGRMLNFDALTATARTMRLPAANPECYVCGSRQAEGGQESSRVENKEQGKDNSGQTINVHAFQERFCTNQARERKDFMLIDVRDRVQFEIASFPGSVNVPWSSLRRVDGDTARSLVEKARGGIDTDTDVDMGGVATFVLVCRRGVLSGQALPMLQGLYPGASVLHVEGGWESFSARVDKGFPTY